MLPFRQRFYAAIVSALLALLLLVIYEATDSYPTNALYFPFCAATAMMDGVDPYGAACLIIAEGVVYPPNPLTTAIAVFPFAPLGYPGTILIWSLFTGILGSV
ncbi:MAG: hypothetical protein Fur005_38020 [Roseiflexaceae bacterium]